MARTLFEFRGRDFNEEHRSLFNAAMGRDYYHADCHVIQEAQEVHICNSRVSAGYIPISRHRSTGVRTVTRRSLKEIRSNSSDTFLVWLPIRGSITITQNGHSTTIGRGNFVFCYANEPLCIATHPDADHEHLSYQITAPAHLVSHSIPEHKRLCGIAFSSERGATRVARELFQSLFEEAEHLDRVSAEALTLSALEAMFRAINQECPEQGRSMGLREVKLRRLMDYLKLHYSDPELTTKKVADACEISTRYLHYLLKSKGTRFYDFLWQARLNSAHKQLTDPALMRRTISEIAYATGFKSSAHFSRAFRNQFGQSPREVRQRTIAANSAQPQFHTFVPTLWGGRLGDPRLISTAMSTADHGGDGSAICHVGSNITDIGGKGARFEL